MINMTYLMPKVTHQYNHGILLFVKSNLEQYYVLNYRSTCGFSIDSFQQFSYIQKLRSDSELLKKSILRYQDLFLLQVDNQKISWTRPMLIQRSNTQSPDHIKQMIFQMIGQDCEDQGFEQIYMKLQNASCEGDVLKTLVEVIGKKRTKELGNQIVEALGKRIKLDPVEQMCSDLRERGLNGTDTQRLKKLFLSGQKFAFEKFLKECFGNQYLAIYQKYKNMIKEQLKKPLPNSKHLYNKKGLSYFQYLEPNLSNSEKNAAKVLMVLGETGSGKSTFLNSIINYLCEVEMCDPIRYQIIVENTSDQTKSITKQINTYFVRDLRNGKVYKLIDTPGFGDTDGMESDKNLVKKLEKKFKEEIQTIDCVMFVIKSTNTRLNHYQRYIFQSVLDLFGKDVAQCFCFILTFSDAGQPPVLQALQHPKEGFGAYWSQVPDPKYIPVNNSAFFQYIDVQDSIKCKYWQIGYLSMSNLINRVYRTKPVSLTLTKEMIKKKQSLSNQIRATRENIQNLNALQLNAKRQIQMICLHEKEINSSQNYQFYISKVEYYSQKTTNNVTRCNNCLNSNCHENCAYGDGSEKKNCCAMDPKGNCNVCPGKCSYIAHTNDHILRKTRTVQQKQTNQGLKAKYDKSLQGKSTAERALRYLIKQLERTINHTNAAYQKMYQLNIELEKIAMTNKKTESFIEYLEMQIKHQNQFRNVGWEERVKQLKLNLEEAKIHENYVKGNRQISKQEMLKQIKNMRKSALLQKASPSLLKKLENIFSF